MTRLGRGWRRRRRKRNCESGSGLGRWIGLHRIGLDLGVYSGHYAGRHDESDNAGLTEQLYGGNERGFGSGASRVAGAESICSSSSTGRSSSGVHPSSPDCDNLPEGSEWWGTWASGRGHWNCAAAHPMDSVPGRPRSRTADAARRSDDSAVCRGIGAHSGPTTAQLVGRSKRGTASTVCPTPSFRNFTLPHPFRAGAPGNRTHSLSCAYCSCGTPFCSGIVTICCGGYALYHLGSLLDYLWGRCSLCACGKRSH